jgi:hypothetical protein
MIKTLAKAALPVALGLAMAGHADAFVVNKTFAGNYWEGPEKDGRGVILDIAPDGSQEFGNTAIVQWFTYRAGEPIWLLGVGSINQNTNVAALDIYEFVGGDFGNAYSVNDRTREDWGTGTLTFNSCNELILEATGTDGSATQVLSPVTQGDCVVQEKFESCPAFATEGLLNGSCIVTGDITQDVTLTNEITWLVRGKVTVTDGATVTIEPNTEIIGGTGAGVDYVVVAQGGKMIADGTQANPIVMRGDTAVARGEWGGLAINGYAPINGCSEGTDVCTAQGEGDSGTYGGNDPQDSSGVYRYMIVSNAGFEFSPENELNGIALQGVGAGTTFEYVQVHLNADDGIEPFGGTVNMKHIVLTGHGDDSFDWTKGYRGKAQYVLIKQYGDDADRAIEADNNGSNNDATPRSQPMLANFTIIGPGSATADGSHGVLIREGTAAHMANFLVTGSVETCFDIDQTATFTQATAGESSIVNSVLGGCIEATFDDDPADPFVISDWVLGQSGNVDTDPQVTNYIPNAGSPAFGIGAVPFEDAFFDNVDFAGAVRDAKSDWTKGWTVGLDRSGPIQ